LFGLADCTFPIIDPGPPIKADLWEEVGLFAETALKLSVAV